MKNKILVLVGVLMASGVIAAAVISSYGSVTGFFTVQQGLTLDILGSSNNENYTLSNVYQGETKYSPEIKLDNKANVPINVSVTVEILPGSAGNGSDVEINLMNEFQNETLPSVVMVPASDFRFYIRHYFKSNANLGEYFLRLNVTPV